MSFSRYFDHIAIVLSAICIVHCLAVPVIVAVMPILAVSFGSDAHFHALMLWLIVPTSVFGFWLGYRVHRGFGLVLLGAAGVAVLFVTALWGHGRWLPTTEVMVSVAGSLVLGSAHWFNFRQVRRCHGHGHV